MADFIQPNTPTTKTTNQWHPHIHIFALLTDWIDQEELAETWHEITLDSYIVDVRRVRKPKLRDTAKLLQRSVSMLSSSAIYRLKNTWHAFLSLKGKRLTGSFGSMHGVKIPDTATPDDKPSEELPYMEMLYRFVFGPKSYYNLEITKDVKPNKRNEEG